MGSLMSAMARGPVNSETSKSSTTSTPSGQLLHVISSRPPVLPHGGAAGGATSSPNAADAASNASRAPGPGAVRSEAVAHAERVEELERLLATEATEQVIMIWPFLICFVIYIYDSVSGRNLMAYMRKYI